MSKPDKDKIIPWLGVVFAGLVLGALGRHIALQQSGDTGTANLTFVIVLSGIVFMYLLLLILWDSIHQIINKKRGVVDSELPAAPPKDCDEPEQNVDYSDVYPYIGGNSQKIDALDEPGGVVVGIEVKSGKDSANKGMALFDKEFHPCGVFLVGTDSIPIEQFLSMNPADLFKL